MTAGIAATIAVPPSQAMSTAPRRTLPDFGFHHRWMLLQVLGVVGKLRDVVALDMMQRIGESHLAIFMMMAVGFTVRCDVHNLRPLAFFGKCRSETGGEML